MSLIGKLVIIMLWLSSSVSGSSLHDKDKCVHGNEHHEDTGAFLQLASSVSAGFLPTAKGEPLKSVFDHIATSNKWRSSESKSGHGSELNKTASVRDCLGQWLQKYSIKSFVDAPCGDANWQGAIPGLPNIHYKGYDIADEPLRIARDKNANHTRMSFQLMDLTSEVPERADVIMSRDVVQHLPLMKGMQLLLNAKRSGAKFLAVTTFNDGHNIDINPGAFYKNNVHASPFGLPPALESCQNYVGKTYFPTDRLELIDLSAWTP